MHRYYLSPAWEFRESREVWDKLLAEIFADAVAVGAVVLPSPYVADDFELLAKGHLMRVEVGLKNGSGAKEGTHVAASTCLHVDAPMTNAVLLLREVARAADYVLHLV